MRWFLYPLAAIGALTVVVLLAVCALAFVARQAEARRMCRPSRATRRSRKRRTERARAHQIRLRHAQQACAQLGVPEPEFEALVEAYRSGQTTPEGRTP